MDVIFNMYKVRYTDLNKLLYDFPKGSVQLFINLEPVLRNLYRSDMESYLKVNRQKRVYEFVSNVINLAAHYRKFFSSQGRSTDVTIFAPSPNNVYPSSLIVQGYRSDVDSKLYNPTSVFGKFVDNALDMVHTILSYIDGVHLVRGENIEPSVIPLLLSNNMPNKVLVTTDRYDYQYVKHDFTIIRPKKASSSYIINKFNLIEMMKLEDKIVSDDTIPYIFIPLVLSFIGDKVRGIPKVKGIGLSKIIQLVKKGISEGVISEDTDNLTLMEDLLIEDIKEHIRNNFLSIDLYTQMVHTTSSNRIKLTSQLVNKFDDVSLRKLNQMFIESPIMLNELMPMKEKKNVFES